jgi:trehalose-6-phosphate synthase
LALEAFLTKYPEWIGKVVLLQIAVPSRSEVRVRVRVRVRV